MIKEEYCKLLKRAVGGHLNLDIVKEADKKELDGMGDRAIKEAIVSRIVSAKKLDFTGLGDFVWGHLEKMPEEPPILYVIAPVFWIEFIFQDEPWGLLCHTIKKEGSRVMSCMFFCVFDGVLTCVVMVQFTSDLGGNLLDMSAETLERLPGGEVMNKGFALVFVMILDYLSCGNVELIRREVVNKKKGKRGKNLGDEYYILTVKTKKGRILYEPSFKDAFDEKTKQKYHFVRGHKRTYTPERPHVSGFVGEMSVQYYHKGDKALGTIFKDYYVAE